MKRSFTLIELLFVIIIAGILASVAMSRFSHKNQLGLATTQIINHIHYTKHLAMTSDKFTPNPEEKDNNWGASDITDMIKGSKYWWKKNFQIIFQSSKDEQVYTIYNDDSSDNAENSHFNAVPGAGEIAYDPHNRIRLTGRYDMKDYSDTLNLYRSFGIAEVIFSKGCSDGKRLVFDNLGRPYNGYNKNSMTYNPYESFYILEEGCLITIEHEDEGKAYICVEPVTGYARVVSAPDNCN